MSLFALFASSKIIAEECFMSFWLTIKREFHRRRSNLESLVSCDYMFVLLRGRLSQQSRRQIVDIKLLIAQNLLIMKARFDNHKLSFSAKYVCVCVCGSERTRRENLPFSGNQSCRKFNFVMLIVDAVETTTTTSLLCMKKHKFRFIECLCNLGN